MTPKPLPSLNLLHASAAVMVVALAAGFWLDRLVREFAP